MDVLGTVLVTVVVLMLIFVLFNIVKMATVTLFSGDVVMVSPLDVPDAQVPILIAAEKQLKNLGFDYVCHLNRTKVLPGQPWGFWGVLYYHSAVASYAFIVVEPIVHPVQDCRWYFITAKANGELMETLSGSDFPPNSYPDSMHINDAMTLNRAEQWRSHLAFVKRESFQAAPKKHANHELLAICEKVFFGGLVESGAIVPNQEGYRLKLKTSIGVFFRTLWVTRKLARQKRGLHNSQAGLREAVGPGQQLEAYRAFKNMQRENHFGRYGKMLLLLVSVLLFGASFGLGFGLNLLTLVLLTIVLFIHESGHLLGMRMFGYSDLKMFFVPFLGALASGKKDTIEPWQEAVVLILGPLPGYVFGLAILFSNQPSLPAWVTEFALLSVILNAINLLPFMPLDGGKLVNLGLFNKLPGAQFGFILLSIGFFVISGIHLGENIAFIVALVLALGVPLLIKEIGLMRKLLKQKLHLQPVNAEVVLQMVFNDEKWLAIAPRNRWLLLDSLTYRMQHAKAGLLTSVGIFTLWIAALLIPLYLSLGGEASSNLLNIAVNMVDGEYQPESIDELKENYETASTFDEKLRILSILIARLSYETDDTLARHYWQEFLMLVEQNDLSNSDLEKYYFQKAALCSSFEEIECRVTSNRSLLAASSDSSKLNDYQVNAYLYLAQCSKVTEAERLGYLDALRNKIDTLTNIQRRPNILSSLANQYYELNEVVKAETCAQRALDLALKDQPHLVRYYLTELANLYAHQGRDHDALQLLDRWQSKLGTLSDQSPHLEMNVQYIKIWLLVEHDVKAAWEALQQISVQEHAQKIELALAQLLIKQKLGLRVMESDYEIFKNANKQASEEVDWYELAYLLADAAESPTKLHGENGRTYIANRWYAALKNTLEQSELLEFKQKLEAIELDYFD